LNWGAQNWTEWKLFVRIHGEPGADIYQIISKRTLQKFFAGFWCDVLVLELGCTILSPELPGVFRGSTLAFLPPLAAELKAKLLESRKNVTTRFCKGFLRSEESGYNSMPKPISPGKKAAVVSSNHPVKGFTSALVSARPPQGGGKEMLSSRVGVTPRHQLHKTMKIFNS